VGARGTGGAALNRLARIHRQRGENDQALDHLRAALLLFRACDDQRGVASCYDDMAQVHRLRGDLEPAVSAAKQALDLRVRTRDRRGQGVSLNTIGYIELDRGRYDAAHARFNSALKIRQAIGDHEGAVQTRIALGRLAFHRGEVEQSIRAYRDALEGAREMDNHRFQSYLLCHLAESLISRDDFDAATQALDEALELATRMRDQRVLADIERNRGLLSLRRGDAAAEEQLQRALSLALEYGTREAIGLAHRGLARLRARTAWSDASPSSDIDLAAREFRESVRAFRACGNRPEAARTQAELGIHLIERGDRVAARAALREAYETMLKLQLPDSERVRETLSAL
jgi:tetratricopeptide (TPR) repeat protein